MPNVVTNEAVLKLISQERNKIFFSSTRPLNMGELIVVNETTTAVVKDSNGVFYTAIVYKNIEAKELRVKNWWAPNQGQIVLLADKQFFIGDKPALLEVTCEVPENYYAGSIGWRLDYESDEISGTILAGSDWRTPTICTYVVPGYWPAGLFTLYATRFNPLGYSKLSSSFISWTVNNPTAILKSEIPLNLF